MSGTSIFISHVSEEAEVAALIRRLLEDDFLGMVKFFTSSDIGSIGAGKEWLTAIQDAMGRADIVLVLCSRSSVQKPWVQFEVGAAWMKGVPIVPVCHSGLLVTDLQMPLSLRQGIELGTRLGLERLYAAIAKELNLDRPPPVRDLAARLKRIAQVEERFRRSKVHQFELFFDVIVKPPQSLAGGRIPDEAPVHSNAASLQLFGLIDGGGWTWGDLVRAARSTPDTRWLDQLQASVVLASQDRAFRPVQAIYHTERGSYQPQLSKKEVLPDGETRFHVHLVDTVVAPLTEVQNDFGLLATLLRLGLRFRYEVIERFSRQARVSAALRGADDFLPRLREAIEVIEVDALSRGAQNFDRDAVAALFDHAEDQREILAVQQEWDVAREALFGAVAPTRAQAAALLDTMRELNYRFMKLGTRRFHEMVAARWDDAPPPLRAYLPSSAGAESSGMLPSAPPSSPARV